MKIDSIMTSNVSVCESHTNLAEIGARMWKSDCGILPVVDSLGVMIGVVTDRDICMALTTRDVPASSLKARDVMTGRVESCKPDEDVLDALHKMRARRVRRLPVVHEDGRLVGMLSLSDLLRENMSRGPLDEDLIDTLQEISEPTHAARETSVSR